MNNSKQIFFDNSPKNNNNTRKLGAKINDMVA